MLTEYSSQFPQIRESILTGDSYHRYYTEIEEGWNRQLSHPVLHEIHGGSYDDLIDFRGAAKRFFEPGSLVIDLGCGTGYGVYKSRMHPKNPLARSHIIGVNPTEMPPQFFNPRSVKFETFDRSIAMEQYVIGRAETLAEDLRQAGINESPDVIVAVKCLKYCAYAERDYQLRGFTMIALQTVLEALKSGGTLLIYEPDGNSNFPAVVNNPRFNHIYTYPLYKEILRGFQANGLFDLRVRDFANQQRTSFLAVQKL